MKVEITNHAGKGSQNFLPSKSAVNQLVKDPRSSAVDYAKAGPDVVRNGPSIVEREP